MSFKITSWTFNLENNPHFRKKSRAAQPGDSDKKEFHHEYSIYIYLLAGL